MGSARSSGSGRQGSGHASGVSTPGLGGSRSQSKQEAACKADAELLQEMSAFDLLHTEHGFTAFGQWYRRVLASGAPEGAASQPRSEIGLLWPQAFCPPNALHEYAFMELLRAFAECSDSEAFDFFDILDCEFLGNLALPQVYLAMCLVAAMGSQQMLKFLYFHSGKLFGMLTKGCPGVAPDHVSWPRLLMLLRLLGAPGHLVSRVGAETGASSCKLGEGLSYDEFLEVMFPIMAQLDRGVEVGESTVINEGDRMVNAKSRMCTIL